MLDFLKPYKWAVEAIAAIAILGGIAYGAHRFLDSVRQEGYDKATAEYNVKLVKAQQDAADKTAQLQHKLQEATNEAALRDKQITNLSTAVAASSSRLRFDLTNYSASLLPDASAVALRGSIDKLGGLLATCSDRYRDMAEDAERERSAKQTLIDAWPK
jgi:hypothetical protein